jgi:hypothetical protein
MNWEKSAMRLFLYSIKAISMNRGREKAVWVGIFAFRGISTHKSGKSGKMALDNRYP